MESYFISEKAKLRHQQLCLAFRSMAAGRYSGRGLTKRSAPQPPKADDSPVILPKRRRGRAAKPTPLSLTPPLSLPLPPLSPPLPPLPPHLLLLLPMFSSPHCLLTHQPVSNNAEDIGERFNFKVQAKQLFPISDGIAEFLAADGAKMLAEESEFQSKGSGRSIYLPISLTPRVSRFTNNKKRIGTSYSPLPKQLHRRRATINVKNTNSFWYSGRISQRF